MTADLIKLELHKMSMKALKELACTYEIEAYPALMERLQTDPRSGAVSLSLSLEKTYKAHLKETDRLRRMKNIEMEYFQKGYRFIAGLDEVGRGPLAGPVVSSAVMMPEGSMIRFVNDSKKLSCTKRDELFEFIKDEALHIGTGIISPGRIDEINILNATKESMYMAINELAVSPELLLIDALRLEKAQIEQLPIIKGDEKCYAIAAASIFAKVTRDRIMDEYHEIYPEYHFRSNKGYGTKEHLDAIKKYGITPIHRLSFLGNFI